MITGPLNRRAIYAEVYSVNTYSAATSVMASDISRGLSLSTDQTDKSSGRSLMSLSRFPSTNIFINSIESSAPVLLTASISSYNAKW